MSYHDTCPPCGICGSPEDACHCAENTRRERFGEHDPVHVSTPVAEVIDTLPGAGWEMLSENMLSRQCQLAGGARASLSISKHPQFWSSTIRVSITALVSGHPQGVSRTENNTIIGWLRELADKIEGEGYGPEAT